MAINKNWLKRMSPGAQAAVRYAAAVVFTIAFLWIYMMIFGSGHPYLVGLFPVIICAVFFRTGPAVLSLLITAVYIMRFENDGEIMWRSALAVGLLLVEGSIVIWVAERRRRARTLLAETLRIRSLELAELKAAHTKLSEASSSQNQSMEQLKRSNQAMLYTLERILGKSNR